MELQTRSPAAPMPPSGTNRDSSSDRRESWGLGIVLTNSHSDLDFEQAAATMGLLTTSYYPDTNSRDNQSTSLSNSSSKHQQQTLPKHPGAESQQQQSNTALSFFGRLASSISALVTSSSESNEDPFLPLDSKSQIEDMLESYYLSQGRPVPEWVNQPPPDPQMTQDMPKSLGGCSSSAIEGSGQIPVSSDPSSSKSSVQGVISRSIARLNFAKLSRPQLPFGGLRSGSASTSENSHTNVAGRTAHDSGFNSPMGLELQAPSIAETPSISVEMADELGNPGYEAASCDTGGATNGSSGYTSTDSFQLDSDRIAASVSASDRESSPGYFSPKWFQKSPKPTVNRWLRGHQDKRGPKKNTGTPISLSSLMPQSTDGKTRSTGTRVSRAGSHQSHKGGSSNGRSGHLASGSVTPIPIKRSPLSQSYASDRLESPSSSAAKTSRTPVSATPENTRGRLSADNDDGVGRGRSRGKHRDKGHLQPSSAGKRSDSRSRERGHRDGDPNQILLRPSSHSRSKSATSNSVGSTPVSSRVKRLFRRKSSHS